ncbi:hypothetical protein TRFO_34096 [Tritrichomonas foetus]|uniref:Protein kinase domain-containing protein n=1 Tax=Tritrichomonas foetus TaxID=1144522 RepID=A0A1J4JLX3_9EUKA|nr:hypothetical protein TRFO_34096 [Tritrichomonas foetus]|eukprot:OHS99423.1 hypothetical protein TRFO_34096 [Tritrichomonas foetus]
MKIRSRRQREIDRERERQDKMMMAIKNTLKEHDYIHIRPIGKGGFSTVHLVLSTRYQEQFVCKVSEGTKSTASEKEIKTLLNLAHPHIINMYEYFYDQSNSYLFIILEYCPGGSLDDVIKANGPLQPKQLYEYCRQTISALSYCHNRGIAHRDIKPANILLDKNGRIQLADFGLSTKYKLLHDSVISSGSLNKNTAQTNANNNVNNKANNNALNNAPDNLSNNSHNTNESHNLNHEEYLNNEANNNRTFNVLFSNNMKLINNNGDDAEINTEVNNGDLNYNNCTYTSDQSRTHKSSNISDDSNNHVQYQNSNIINCTINNSFNNGFKNNLSSICNGVNCSCNNSFNNNISSLINRSFNNNLNNNSFNNILNNINNIPTNNVPIYHNNNQTPLLYHGINHENPVSNEVHSDESSNEVEARFIFAGSRAYMSPQLINKQKFDPFKADIWALGVTFYQLSSGEYPWQITSDHEMKMGILMGLVNFRKCKASKDFKRALKYMLQSCETQRCDIKYLENLEIFKKETK